MLQEFKVKPMFKNQYHEGNQFTLKFKDNIYQGIFRNREIMWFYPVPHHKYEKKVVQKIELKVNELMTSQAYHGLKVKPLFEDQFHERHQFTLNIEEDYYQGIYYKGKIQWFHPQPNTKLEEKDLRDLEDRVYNMMTNHLT
ncbi:hypothetical protein V7114_24830 [Neobacillus niacini]|uniref:DUF5342 family protein n=1 Tax=Neobacillus niacini TaxID=86668 RepID=UPI002FFFAF37